MRVRKPNVNVRRPNSLFALRTQRLHCERECLQTERGCSQTELIVFNYSDIPYIPYNEMWRPNPYALPYINELELDLQLGRHNSLFEIYGISLLLNIRYLFGLQTLSSVCEHLGLEYKL